MQILRAANPFFSVVVTLSNYSLAFPSPSNMQAPTNLTCRILHRHCQHHYHLHHRCAALLIPTCHDEETIWTKTESKSSYIRHQNAYKYHNRSALIYLYIYLSDGTWWLIDRYQHNVPSPVYKKNIRGRTQVRPVYLSWRDGTTVSCHYIPYEKWVLMCPPMLPALKESIS